MRWVWRGGGGVLLGLAVTVLWMGMATAEGPIGESSNGGATVVTATQVIDTYNYAPYLDWRYSEPYELFYPHLDWDVYREGTPAPLGYTALVLENAYLRLTLLPELGGRVYACTLKLTGNNELYSNVVVRPTRWGPPEQGWWMAVGGLEWGFPVEEHGYEWGVPWEYAIDDGLGGVTVTLRDTSEPRLRVAVAVYLPDEGAWFDVCPRLENPTGEGKAFAYWTDAMLAPGGANTVSPELRFLFPADEVTVHSRWDESLPAPGEAMSWPVYEGVDYSRLGNWTGWLGFFARPQATVDYAGVYDPEADEGIVRVFPAEIAVGLKAFAWGWSDRHPAVWTRDGSYYVEIHGGPAPTFWADTWLPAGGTLSWCERWFPVARIGGVTSATERGALFLQAEGGMLRWGVYPLEAYPLALVGVWRRGDERPLWAGRVAIGPDAPISMTLAASAGEYVVSVLDREGDLVLSSEADPERWPPEATVEPLPSYTTVPTVEVRWTGQDWGSCVLFYDVQVRDGVDGAWTDWLTRTLTTTAPFVGQDGHTYFFRARAVDLFGNKGRYGGARWGQASISVLLTPAAVFDLSGQAVDPAYALPGDRVTFTLTLRNTGNLTATVRVTDRFPVALEVITTSLVASAGGSPWVNDEGWIVWEGKVAPLSVVWISGTARLGAGVSVPGRVSWPVELTWEDGGRVWETELHLGRAVWLPLVWRGR